MQCSKNETSIHGGWWKMKSTKDENERWNLQKQVFYRSRMNKSEKNYSTDQLYFIKTLYNGNAMWYQIYLNCNILNVNHYVAHTNLNHMYIHTRWYTVNDDEATLYRALKQA